ncbi:MAG: hypothetical protein ACRBBW_14290 [Cellvibrionaceae bacterium]
MPASRNSLKTTAAFTSKLALVSLAACIALTGCSQQQKRPALNETFNTQTADDGSKRFVYSVSPDRSQQKRPPRNSSDHQGRKKPADNNRADRQEKIAAAAKEMLDSTLEEMQFCPQGYKVLDSTFDRGRYIIHGECLTSTDN